MTAAEVVILIFALIVGVGLLLRLGGLFGGGAVGDRSHRGRVRSRAERETIEREHDLARFSPTGGHQPEPPGMRKPPSEGGLL